MKWLSKQPRTSRWPIKRGRSGRPRKMALVIAAHNEEMFISLCIYSALAAGQLARDIYVVDDGSKDGTRRLALELLGSHNVMSIRQSGKSLALIKVIKRKELLKKYEWIHFADADSLFDKNYFKHIRAAADPKYAAVTGYIKSLPGTKTSEYRIHEYTLGMEIMRRVQTPLNLISVIPGPSFCIRSEVLEHIDIDGGKLTEDFDWTLQIHRKNLGPIGYTSEAKIYTQDPKNLKDYKTQLNRWYRGIWQVARQRRLGLKFHRQDLYFLYQIVQLFSAVAVLAVVAPLSVVLSGSWAVASWLFLMDLGYMALTLVFTAVRNGRLDIINGLPYFYAMRWISVMLFIRAFFAVMIMGRYRSHAGGWSTADRRYRLA